MGMSSNLFAGFVTMGFGITGHNQAQCGRQVEYIITGRNALLTGGEVEKYHDVVLILGR